MVSACLLFQNLGLRDAVLICLNLYSLEQRRIRGDPIETYKLISLKKNIDSTQFFSEARDNNTRGYSLKLYKQRSRLELRKHFFSQRVVNHWNELPELVVSAPALTISKIVSIVIGIIWVLKQA